jgi:hypothetical protein
VTAGLDYPDILRRATLGLVREVLERAAADGLPGAHHLFLTFRTGDPGVRLPAALVRQFPETMTVVLQHQYWDLAVETEAFEVTLRFAGAYERVRVPFDALTTFLDPSVPFGLDFTQFAAAQAADAAETPAADGGGAPAAGPVRDAPAAPAEGVPGDVLPFRRRED